jgi:hypothetical protein
MNDDTGGGLGRLVGLIAGAGAIAAGTALGWDAAALTTFVAPPVLLRAALVGGSVAVGIWLLTAALGLLAADRIGLDGPDETGPPDGSGRDIGSMTRGVRLVFLAVAAFAAGAGWLLGHPLPLVVALVIAGVDVLETSFLLLVVNLRSRS